VDKLAGEPEAKRRLQVILETVAGQKSVAQACEELGIGEARFHELRAQALQAAVTGLEAGASGRPRKEEPPESAEVKALREERDRLKLELRLSQTREELAVALPHVLKRKEGAKAEEKKTPRPPPIITNPPSSSPDGSGG
jgi:hypothetical protein